MEFKYPKIFQLGTSRENDDIFVQDGFLVAQEKLDGSCTSFYLDNNQLTFCSRNRVMGTIVDPMWKKAAQFVNEKFTNKPYVFETDLIYFGETMEKHTINYKDPPPFVGFDIMDKNTGYFFNWEKSKQLFEKMDIPFAPVLMSKRADHYKLEELKQLVDQMKSIYGDFAEGIVLKRYDRLNQFGRPLWGKLVKDSFRERNLLVFSGLKELRDTERRLVEEFANPARIRKCILKLTVEENNELSMKLMPVLFKFVGDDILSNEILSIKEHYPSIQFKDYYNMVAAKCAKELKNYMAENQK
ncbi:MAG: RNA ligase family protein [Nanoarchaeota archaeon]